MMEEQPVCSYSLREERYKHPFIYERAFFYFRLFPGGVLSAAVLGIRTVAAFNLEKSMHAKFSALYQETFAKRMKEAVINGLLLGYTQVSQSRYRFLIRQGVVGR